jgi:uncharacterized protein
MSEKRPRKASHSFQFNVAQLLKQPGGTRRTYDFNTTDAPPLDEEVRITGPMRGRVQFTRVGTGILVTGKLETLVELECGRCLSPVEGPVAFEIEEEFRPTVDIVTGVFLPRESDQDEATLIDEQHILDLGEVIRQDLVLALPASPVCSPVCRGLCPHCGQNLNEAICDCENEVVDPRWAALRESSE